MAHETNNVDATSPLFPQGDEEFEEFDPDDDIGLIDTEFEVPLPYGFTWAYDFNSEDLDFSAGNPPILRDHKVVNEWIRHTINTEQFETPILGSDIGTAVNDLIGTLLDPYVMNRVRDEIHEAITIHDRIEEVTHIMTFSVMGNVYTYFSYETDDEIEGQSLIQLR